jgi:hypothetical protein
MFIAPIVGWVKSLAEQFSKPQTYGSALEQYIVSHNPQNSADVDRLMRDYEHRQGYLL